MVDKQKLTARCLKYIIQKDVFDEIALLNKKRTGSSVCILENKWIYVFGGYREDGDCLDYTERIEVGKEKF